MMSLLTGRATLLEDCDTLDLYTKQYQRPPTLANYYGSSLLVRS